MLILGIPLHANAACTDPDRPDGTLVYNVDHGVLQRCVGSVWRAEHPFAENSGLIPSGCPNIGDQCSGGSFDGLYYIGNVGGNDIYAAENDEPTTLAWGGAGSDADADSDTDGLTNTDWLVDTSPNSHPAAEACHDRGPEWYLPAEDELALFWNGGTPVAGVLAEGTWYWSSTEFDNSEAKVWRFNTGTSWNRPKGFTTAVRCVRRY